MTTFHNRQRMLSISRRDGFQGSAAAAAGIAQRQREDELDGIEDTRQREAVSLAIDAMAFFAVAVAIAAAVWLAVLVLA